ncbi:MAG: DUF2945 domain-containing protein [Pseudomonadota bacterium]
MTQRISIGDTVEWDWGTGTAQGKVTQIYTEKVTKSLQGAEVTRNATDDEPALLIKQKDGAEVLKSTTEVRET